MKEQFREIRFRVKSLLLVEQMVAIVEEYSAQGLRMTARQLYYQLVSRDVIPNTVQSYKNATSLLADARYAGLVDWDAIEDRGRVPTVPSEWSDLASLVESAVRAYRLPRWEDQRCYVELWVEKQALAGVLEPLARRHHVTLSVNKGYSSASAMYAAAGRFLDHEEKDCRLLYLGDHDPSGEDMVRDVRDRLREFGVRDLTVTKLALTWDQIQQYDPPPNPAKLTDSRAKAYVAKYGTSSWEVDALPPNVLSKLINDAIDELVDVDALRAVLAKEDAGRAALRRAAQDV